VRRRICLAVTVVGAAPLAIGVAAASAAPAAPAKPKPIVLNCNIQLTAAPLPGNGGTVDQPPTSGWMYGPFGCPRQGFGSGVEAASFTVPLSGDTVGSFTQYLGAGSIKGKFDLVPQEDLSSSFFSSATWTGDLTVTRGTGVYKGIKSNRNAGTMTCTSDDTVHLACTEKVKVKLPTSG
jgi:hypothetical protein